MSLVGHNWQQRGYARSSSSSSPASAEPVVRSLLERLCHKIHHRPTTAHLKLAYRILSVKTFDDHHLPSEAEVCEAVSRELLNRVAADDGGRGNKLGGAPVDELGEKSSSKVLCFQALRRAGLGTDPGELAVMELLLRLASASRPSGIRPSVFALSSGSGGGGGGGGGTRGIRMGTPGGRAAAGARPPSSAEEDLVYCGASEREILRDCLYALQGIQETDTVFWDAAAECFKLKPTVSIARGAQALVRELLQIGTEHAAVREILKRENESCVFGAFRDAVTQLLQEYFKWIAIFEAQNRAAGEEGQGASEHRPGREPQGELTLRKLAIWFRQPGKKISLLAQLCKVASAAEKGGPLLSALYQCRKRTGDPVCGPVVEKLLRAAQEPMAEMVQTWMTEGKFHDPLGEFFVVADAKAKIEDLWHHMYFLNPEMVPCFVDLEQADMILRTGKSVNFIRLCCEESDWVGLSSLPRRGEVIFSSSTAAQTAESTFIREQSLRTNKRLVELLLDKYHLLNHCAALKRYLLLAQGDFIECFLEFADGALRKDAKKEVFRHNIRALVDQAVRHSNAQYHDPEFLDRLDVSLAYANAGEIGWDVFSLDYAVTSPLHVVFSREKAMAVYRKVSTFLWKLRRANYSLKDCWKHQILIRHKAEEDGIARVMDSIRMNLSHVIQNVQSYVMYEVLETAHARLENGLQQAKDLDEVLREHANYLTHLQEFTFLVESAAPILQCLTKFFSLVGTFEQLQEDVARFFFEETEGVEEMITDDLDALDSEVTETTHHFLDLLQQPGMQHHAEYTYLVCRLNFNDHFQFR